MKKEGGWKKWRKVRGDKGGGPEGGTQCVCSRVRESSRRDNR